MASREQISTLHERFANEAIPWIEKRTVPIYKISGSGFPVPEGSGVLLQVADRYFVVTAAHVLRLWKELALIIPTGERNGINLTACLAEATTDQHELDFALIPLFPEMVDALLPVKEFVRLADIDVSGDEPPLGIHAVFGYPQELAKRDADGLTSLAIFHPSTLMRLADMDPSVSIAMEIHGEMVDGDGDRSRLPSLQCISGCGIWRLHAKGDDVETWTVDRVRLVGIEHTVLPGNWIRGVRIRQVVGGIATRFPALEPCVALLGIKVIRPTTPNSAE